MSSLIVEVCEIKNIERHPNADKLDVATVKGWQCIVGREQYKVGDWVVFFPPDSVLPNDLIEQYELEFLKKGGRVGVLKLRGFISQGLVLPVGCVPSTRVRLGDDVAKILGVTKYEVQERVTSKAGKVTSKKVQNPYFTKYTDIENVRNFDEVFKYRELVVITEKIHGSNIRFGWLPIEINFRNGDLFGILRSLWRKYVLKQTHEFVYGSHNVQLQWDNEKNFYGKNIYAEVLKKYDTENLPRDYIFYGEVYGKGVQDLGYGKDELTLAIFDVKYVSENVYLDWEDVEEICKMENLPIVPVLHGGYYSDEMLLTCTSGSSKICDDQIREGCVVKPLVEQNHPRLGRKILKSINPEYLTRKNGTEFK